MPSLFPFLKKSLSPARSLASLQFRLRQNTSLLSFVACSSNASANGEGEAVVLQAEGVTNLPDSLSLIIKLEFVLASTV